MTKERKIVNSSGFTFHFIVETIFFSFIFSIVSTLISGFLESAELSATVSTIINAIIFAAITYFIFYCSVIRVCGVKELDRNYTYQVIKNITIYIIIYAVIQVLGGYYTGMEALNDSLVYSFYPELAESMKSELIAQMIPLLAIKGVICLSLIPLVKKWLLPRV